MVNLNDFHPTKCVICDTFGNATEIYPANFDLEAFNPGIFSARRLPDRIHYRIIRCKVCGLVRSDPVVNRRILASLYTQSSFSYADEAINSRYAYGRYLDRLNKYLTEKNTLLEIGCGNGFFL
ncbi:MAG: hypothetical protein KKA52_04360 [Candidatus Omnitrophica bacterium]|nr:hypothetical protein [Candidatus Omnitrophota bacterium]